MLNGERARSSVTDCGFLRCSVSRHQHKGGPPRGDCGERVLWKQKYDASESEKQAVRKELAAVRTLVTGPLLFYMIRHPFGGPFFAGLASWFTTTRCSTWPIV
jgi:hypothetical protein